MDTSGEQRTTLSEQLKERQRQQLEEVERVTQKQLTQLAESMTRHVEDVLSTTKIDMAQRGHEIRKTLNRTEKQLESTTSFMSQRLQALSRMPDEELSTIAERLSYDLRKAHKQAISESLMPLRSCLLRLRQDSQRLQAMINRLCLKRLMLGICTGMGLLIAITLGTLGMDQLLTARLEKLSDLNQMINHQKETMVQLQDRTWGLKLVDSAEGRFIILPVGTTVETNWKVNNEERVVMKIKEEG